MSKNVKPELSLDKYELPQSLAASLDIEELERRLELSEMDMMAYSATECSGEMTSGPWEESGEVVYCGPEVESPTPAPTVKPW
jgi:hypothetical protein